MNEQRHEKHSTILFYQPHTEGATKSAGGARKGWHKDSLPLKHKPNIRSPNQALKMEILTLFNDCLSPSTACYINCEIITLSGIHFKT